MGHFPCEAICKVFLFCALPLAFFPAPTHSGSGVDLAALQASARNGYITVDDSIFSQVNRELSDGKLSLFIFFDAAEHEDMPRDFVEPLLEEFNVASRSYEAHRDKSASFGLHRVFFCRMDFAGSEKTFRLLQVSNLPTIKFLSKTTGKTGKDCNLQELDGKADGFLHCLSSVSGLPVGPVHRARTIQQLVGVPCAVLGALVFLYGASRVIVLTKEMIQMPVGELLGCCLALAVYVFSISGIMYTIINKMPMYYWTADKPTRLMVVLPGDEQLGFEGLAAGTLYTSAGLALAFLINVAPYIRSGLGKRLICYFCEISFSLCVFVIFYFQRWKRSG